MAIVPTDLGEFHGEPPPGDLLPERMKRQTRARRALRIVTSFFIGQGAIQGVSVLTGLYLVRAMSIESYAQFSLAVGFQAVFTALMDLGFASTIIPMVGERGNDPAVIGRYVRGAKHLRDRAFWILAPVAVVAFFTIMRKQHWDWKIQLLLIGSILLALYSSGKVSYYSAPLFIQGRLREYYLPQLYTGVGRFASSVALSAFGGLNAWTAAGISALNVSANASLLARKSRPHMEWPEKNDPAIHRELLHYILPAAPAMIFSAFQAQITLFLISVFGGTLYIAQVAALSKIGQLFSVLMTFNLIVIEPYFARVGRPKLLKTFAGFVFLATLVCVPVVLVGFYWPQGFLWLLGSKYQGLTDSLGWVVLSACMNYVAGLIWIMNRSRKWVFWSGTFLEIILILGIEATYVALVGVRTTHEAVMLSFASSFGYLIAHGYVSCLGFVRGPRATSSVA